MVCLYGEEEMMALCDSIRNTPPDYNMQFHVIRSSTTKIMNLGTGRIMRNSGVGS